MLFTPKLGMHLAETGRQQKTLLDLGRGIFKVTYGKKRHIWYTMGNRLALGEQAKKGGPIGAQESVGKKLVLWWKSLFGQKGIYKRATG